MLAQHRLFLPWQYTCVIVLIVFFINDLILVFVPGILADIIIILPSQDLALKPDIRLLQRPDIRPNMQLDLYKQRPEMFFLNLKTPIWSCL